MQFLRSHYLDRLEAATYKPISELYDSSHGSLDFCPRAERKVARYAMELCGMTDGVGRLSGGVLTLTMAWEALRAMARNISDIEKAPCQGCKQVCTIPMAEPIARATIDSSEEIGGLCLYCEKDGQSPSACCDHIIGC